MDRCYADSDLVCRLFVWEEIKTFSIMRKERISTLRLKLYYFGSDQAKLGQAERQGFPRLLQYLPVGRSVSYLNNLRHFPLASINVKI